MPRARKRPLFPVALSPAAAADALGVSPKKIREAINSGALSAYDAGGNRVRILVCDLVEYVRSWWPHAKRRKRS